MSKDLCVYEIYPKNCISCNEPIEEKIKEFRTRMNRGENPAKILDELKVFKMCCRLRVLTPSHFISVPNNKFNPSTLLKEMSVTDDPIKRLTGTSSEHANRFYIKRSYRPPSSLDYI